MKEKGTAIHGDVSELASDTIPTDFQDGEEKEQQKESSIPDFEVLVGGFPCKDVPTLSKHRKTNQDVIQKRSVLTGSAFRGIIKLLRRSLRCPLKYIMGVLENVKHLAMILKDTETGEKMSFMDSNLAVCIDELYINGFRHRLDARSSFIRAPAVETTVLHAVCESPVAQRAWSD